MKTDIQQARAAITTFRDAARQGVEIGFRQRDPLVALLHDALDEFEQTDKQVATLTAALRRQIEKWHETATTSREESERIRRTINAATDAEERCLVRAEIWDKCADELDAVLRAASEGAP